MCGRYAFYADEDNAETARIMAEIKERCAASPLLSSFKPGEVFPSTVAPLYIAAQGGGISPTLMRWGFPRPGGARELVINARAETARQKPMFASSLAKSRCAVPASGFFEWKRVPEGKPVKHYITLGGSNAMYLAGLYRVFVTDGAKQENFVILTTDANEWMLPLHDRMPLILTRNEAAMWCAGELEEYDIMERTRSLPLDIVPA